MENPVETKLRAQLRSAEEALGNLMEDVREAGNALCSIRDRIETYSGVTSPEIEDICDDLMGARDRANASWAKWKRDDPR